MRKICISKDWFFEGDDGAVKKVDLPHDYVITTPREANRRGGDAIGYFGGYSGKYSKYMKFEPAAHTILDIDGAYMCARIFFNDDMLDMHPNGYMPYLVDLTGKIREGRNNKIGINVTNVQPSTRWYSGSGVYRDVYLWTGGKVRIEPWDIFVTTSELSEKEAEIKVKFTVSADMDCPARVQFSVHDSEDAIAAASESEIDAKTGKNDEEISIKIDNPHCWDCDNPYLYTIKVRIVANGETEDETELKFGIRTISADAEHGLLLNGKSIKLRGGCIHHDHGVLGSAEFPAAVRRKLARLQSVGYNSVRTAHNPPSLTFLEACDEMGILVMDEAFDMWNIPKQNLDYSLWFRDWWQRDISYMVLRDRNHPSVISYSIGNEIWERNGNSDGAAWSQRLSDEIRKYDKTRLVTSGVCGMWGWYDDFAPDDYKEDFMGGYKDIGSGDLGSTFTERTEGYMKPLDIVGYNYFYTRYDEDSEKYPDRVIWGSETHALTFFDSWQAVMKHPNVLGDFTWTAYDNMGEVGTGRFAWSENGYIKGISTAEYPWRTCYQGDFDLCGYRRPQSYFREAVWRVDAEPHIFTTHPKHNGDDFSGTGWHWYDVCETWTFEDEYIGVPVKVDVYTTADEIEFALNGKTVGSAKPQKGIATIEIPYEKGELTATSFKDGKKLKSFSLRTTGEEYAVRVVSEKDEIIGDNCDLCYFDISIVDKDGNVVTESKRELKCEVFGGEFMGIFSGDPKNEDSYGSDKCHAFGGRAVAIARCERGKKLTVRVTSEGLKGGVSNEVKIVGGRV